MSGLFFYEQWKDECDVQFHTKRKQQQQQTFRIDLLSQSDTKSLTCAFAYSKKKEKGLQTKKIQLPVITAYPSKCISTNFSFWARSHQHFVPRNVFNKTNPLVKILCTHFEALRLTTWYTLYCSKELWMGSKCKKWFDLWDRAWPL